MEILNYLGKFHPVVLHLPIGALYLTFCLFLLEKFFKTKYTIPIRFGLLFSFAFSVLSAVLGYFLYLGDDFSGDLIIFICFFSFKRRSGLFFILRG